jgi:nitrite reductase (NO-forming)
MTMSKITRKHIVLMVASGWLAMTGLGATDVATAAGLPTAEQAGDLGPPKGAPIEDKLIDRPNVAPPIHHDYSARVIVNLETRDAVKEIADGVR